MIYFYPTESDPIFQESLKDTRSLFVTKMILDENVEACQVIKLS